MTEKCPENDQLGPIVDAFVEECRRSPRPSVDEYVRRYPEWAGELRDLLSTVALMEDAKQESLERTESGRSSLMNTWNAPPRLGDYRIVREIGRGGMGVVYEADQVSLGRRVALKVLPAAAALDAKRLARFQREAQAVAQLHHTHIASVHGIGEADGIHFIVMQYLPGYSLDIILAELDRFRQSRAPSAQAATEKSPGDSSVTDVARALWIRAAGLEPHHAAGERDPASVETQSHRPSPQHVLSPISEHPGTPYYRNVAQIGLQVAEALAYAHGQDMLHRDVKPSNLLLDVHGMVWLTDFGLAKQAAGEGLTQPGDVLGTLRYMAPEALRGSADARSDLYSLGLTLFELVGLEPARSASQREGLVEQVQRGTIPSLRKLNPRIPLDLATIIHKAAAAEPAQRYPTAAEMAADLGRFLADTPIHARRVTIAERTLRWTRRNPAISLATSLSAAAVLITVLIAFLSINAAKNRALSWAEENSQLAAREREAKQQAQAALTREAEQRKKAQQSWRQAEAARAEQEQTAKEARAVTDFLVLDMIGASKPERNLGRELTVRDMLDRAAQRVGTAFPEQPRTEAAVRAAIGQAYHALGSYDQSLEQLQTARELQSRLLGPEHLTTLQTAINVGTTLHALGKHADEQELEQKTLAVLQAKYGTEHPTALEAAGNLAANLYSQGKHQQAQELFEQTLKRKISVLGLEHESTLATMSNLAYALQEQGRLRDSEELNRKILAIRRRKVGEDHPNTLRTLGNLAQNLDRQKRHAEAEPLHRQVLAARRRVLGDEHSDTLAAINNLAVNVGAQGKKQEEMQLMEESLAAYRRTLGPKHPSTIALLNNTATTLLELGDNEAAAKQLAEAAAAAEEVLGAEHPTTVEILNNLAQALANQAKFAEADVVLTKVLHARENKLGSDHVQTAQTRIALGAIRSRLGRLPETQELYERAMSVYRQAYGPDDPRTLPLQNQLAGTYLLQRNYAQASTAFATVLETLRRQPDSDPASQMRVMINLGAALAKQGKTADAIRVYEEVHARLPRTPGIDGIDAADVAKLLDSLRQGRTDMIDLQPGGTR